MRRLPILPTLIVLIAVAIMIGLGIWQLKRMAWKDALLQRYAAAATQPAMAWPRYVDSRNPPFFRRASGYCLSVASWRAASGRNRSGDAGWVHIASCRTGAEGPGMQAVMGWSERPDHPSWSGGAVSGIIAPDSRSIIRLVADKPAPGLQPAEPPNLQDIPNNHLAYAVQWFLFAFVALIIYGLALRRRAVPPA
jgi:hypothetical protein